MKIYVRYSVLRDCNLHLKNGKRTQLWATIFVNIIHLCDYVVYSRGYVWYNISMVGTTEAYLIAKQAHMGQTRRDGRTAYFNHVDEVAQRVSHLSVEHIVVAYLHDVLEDTDFTVAQLKSLGVSQYCIDSIVLLTKKKGQKYMDYLEDIRRFPLTRDVKIADMLTNLADEPTTKQIKKYAKGLTFLTEFLK